MSKGKSSKSIPVTEKLSSIRLTIFLCLLLALFSLVGTLVPQDLSPEQYAAAYGKALGRLVTLLGLSDVYHSPGFVFLLSLLAANLLACTWKRFPAVWRSMRKDASAPRDTEFRSWKNQEEFRLSAGPGDIGGSLEEAVSRVLGRGVKGVTLESGTRFFAREKNRIARIGPYLAHVSILIILAGGVVGGWFGFSGTLILSEGQQVSSVQLQGQDEAIPLGFQLRCDRFFIEHYGNPDEAGRRMPPGVDRMVREYRSEVTLLDEQGRKLADAQIRVNHPLTYKGVSFYQSTYGQNPTLSLQVRNTQGGQETKVETGLNSPFVLPGDRGDRGVVVDFQEQLHIPEQMMRMTKFSSQNLGPAARIGILVQDQGFSNPVWVFKDHPEMGGDPSIGYRFSLESYRSTPYTGLQAKRDPGTGLVWTGCVLLVLGFGLSFFLDHEILYATIEPKGQKGSIVRLAGRAVRHPAVYAGRFAKRSKKMREALSPWLRS